MAATRTGWRARLAAPLTAPAAAFFIAAVMFFAIAVSGEIAHHELATYIGSGSLSDRAVTNARWARRMLLVAETLGWAGFVFSMLQFARFDDRRDKVRPQASQESTTS